MAERQYKSFAEFYPYYLSEHQDSTCRKLHFTGTALLLLILASSLISQIYWGLALIPFVGYGFAWVGHFFYEKNRPATFTYPLWSLASDFNMFFQILVGKLPVNPQRQL